MLSGICISCVQIEYERVQCVNIEKILNEKLVRIKFISNANNKFYFVKLKYILYFLDSYVLKSDHPFNRNKF